MFGSVVWYDEKKGFGFLRPDGADKDVFVHASEVELSDFGTLVKEQRLAFDIVEGPKGRPSAARLRRVDGGQR